MRRDTSWRMLVAAFFLLMLAGGAAHAAIDPAKVQKLLAGDGADDDQFGFSVAVSGDTAVIGAYYDDDKGSKSGSAYVFVRAVDGTWSQQAKLTAADGAADDMFGSSVAVSGDMAIIGANRDDDKGDQSGSAYVFVRAAAGGSWSQQQKLTAADGAANDHFGCSVSVEGDTAVIGANGDDILKGAVYAFTKSGNIWSPQQKLTAAAGTGIDQDVFGSSVSLSSDGSIALIGANFYAGERGAAYIFTRSGSVWSQQQRLTALDGEGMDAFGHSVSLSADGGTALIGAFWNDGGKGAAYIFTRSGGTWSEQKKLTAVDGATNDSFGDAVALSADGGTALIAASRSSNTSGSAYVFTRSGGTWSQQQKLTAPAGATDSFFGGSISMDGDTAIIGAYGNYSKGSAYIYGSSTTPPVTSQGAAQSAINLLLRK